MLKEIFGRFGRPKDPPQPPSVEKPSIEERFEKFWEAHREDIKQELNSQLTVDEFTGRDNLQEEAVALALENERLFAFKVFQVVDSVLEGSNKTALLLWDVDGTLGYGLGQEKGQVRTVLRPVIKSLFAEFLNPLIKEKKLNMGLMSTRGKQALTEQLEDPQNLQPLKPYFNRRFIFSANDYESGISEGVIREASEDFRPTMGDQAKITSLSGVRKQSPPEIPIIVADDDRYSQFLNSGNNFYGIDVSDCPTLAPYEYHARLTK